MDAIKKVGGGLLCIFVLAVWLGNRGNEPERLEKPVKREHPPEHHPQPKAERKLDCAMQGERFSFLQKSGFIKKVDYSGSTGRLWIRPEFYVLEFEYKQLLANVAYAWCVCENTNVNLLILKDSLSGNNVGTFSETLGLRMD